MDRRAALPRVLAVVAVTATLLSGPVPAQARSGYLDPAQLGRGPDPRVAHLVGDTIVDGHRRVPATRLGDHLDLWTTRRGYLLYDQVEPRDVFRLVYVSRSGDKRVIARWVSIEASPRAPRSRRADDGSRGGRTWEPQQGDGRPLWSP